MLERVSPLAKSKQHTEVIKRNLITNAAVVQIGIDTVWTVVLKYRIQLESYILI